MVKISDLPSIKSQTRAQRKYTLDSKSISNQNKKLNLNKQKFSAILEEHLNSSKYLKGFKHIESKYEKNQIKMNEQAHDKALEVLKDSYMQKRKKFL